MLRTAGALATALFIAAAAQAATIHDDFGAAANTGIFSVSGGAPVETPQVSNGGIGNKWGAWAPGLDDQSNRIYFHTAGDLRFGQYGSMTKTGNVPGAYAYTIFSTSGGGAGAINSPVSYLGAIVVTPVTLYQTLTETIRLLIRDGNGQWLISKETYSMPPGTNTPQTYPTSGMTWASVPPAAAADMDEMNADAGPGDISTFSGTVAANLTNVGGSGVYIDTVVPTGGGVVFKIEWMEFQEGPPPVNRAPSFTADAFTKPDATVGLAYSQSIATDASDPDGDPLTFAKESGPAWLSVAGGGALTGTPGAGDVGPNVFTVSATDPGDLLDTATLHIAVGTLSTARRWTRY